MSHQKFTEGWGLFQNMYDEYFVGWIDEDLIVHDDGYRIKDLEEHGMKFIRKLDLEAMANTYDCNICGGHVYFTGRKPKPGCWGGGRGRKND